jgi:hypothetical protein
LTRQSQEWSSAGALQRRQDEAFAPSGTVVTGVDQAERFLHRVGIALRYGRTAGLPLASLYEAFGARSDKASMSRAIILTNQLLGKGHAVETHVIASRVCLVHRAVMPALYALVRRQRKQDDIQGLSVHARTALSLLRQRSKVTAGDVREKLGLPFDERRDPAYAALGELMQRLLVDRGPFEIPKAGIPYLSTEGYPYHLFHEAHPDLVAASRGVPVVSAASTFLEAYLRGALFARVRKMASLFRCFLSPAEIDTALGRLLGEEKITLVGSGQTAMAIVAGPAP